MMDKGMKKITTRQLIIFYCIYSFSIKFLSLPHLLALGAGHGAWIAAGIGTALELGVLFLALNVLAIGNGSDLYSDLRANTKWVGAKFLILLMLLVFLLQLFILMGQTNSLMVGTLFDKLNVHKFLVPLLLLGILFCFMPARAIFRGGEVFFLLIIIGLALSVFPALGNIRFGEFSRTFDGGAWPIFETVFRYLIYFESAAFLLVFSGDIKVTKDFRKKFMGAATAVGLFFFFFVFMFIGVFGPLAPIKNVAITDFTVHGAFLVQSGRLDWVLICIWLLLLLVRFGATFYACFACLRYLFNIKHRAGYIGFGIAVFLYLMYYFLFASPRTLDDFIRTMAIPIAVLFFLVPVACFVNAMILKRRRRNV